MISTLTTHARNPEYPFPFARPYAPSTAIYLNHHLVPCPPLAPAHAAKYVTITASHEPGVATISDLLFEKTPPKRPSYFIAEYRIVKNADGTIEWFKYVNRMVFQIWLRLDDTSRDDSTNLQDFEIPVSALDLIETLANQLAESHATEKDNEHFGDDEDGHECSICAAIAAAHQLLSQQRG
ncbi:hypothetical protein EON80_23200, partial [bacterium]